VIGLTGDPFAQAPHEPGKARQPRPQNRQTIGISGEHGHVEAVRLTWLASQLVALGKKRAPSNRDLIIGPLPGDVGSVAKYDV
jgi:hypothetical protein